VKFQPFASITQLVTAHRAYITQLEQKAGICSTLFDIHFTNVVRELIRTCGKFIGPGKVGIYELTSNFNHSCAPDAEIVLNGDSNGLRIRALRAMKRGEEVKINYLDSDTSDMPGDHHKRHALLQKFGFTCQCSLCLLQKEFPYNPLCSCGLCNLFH
jgi:hypothetical protein